MLSRYQAADPAVFAAHVESVAARDKDGDVQYACSVMIDGERHGAVWTIPGETTYSEARMAEGIVKLYEGLAQDGFIGHENLVRKPTVTLTGRPDQDLIQVAAAIANPASLKS